MIIKYWRELVILTLVIFSLLSVRTCTQKDSTITLLTNVKDSAFLVAKTSINKYGESVNQVKTLEATVDQLKDENLDLGFDNKKLKGEIGNLNRLVAHWKGVAHKVDTITMNNIDTVLVENGDTVKAKWFEYKNKWLDLAGVTTPRLTRIAYTYQVDFTITAFRKPQGLFKPSQIVTNVTFNDPSVTIGQFQGVVIKEPPKKFFEKPAFWGLVGFGLGVIATK